MTTKLTTINIFTDGSTAPTNPGYSGWGYYAVDNLNNQYTGYGAVGINSTNNQAELVAVISALSYFIHLKENLTLILHLDSNYVLDGIKNLPNREVNNYQTKLGTTIANLELWKTLSSLLKKLNNNYHDVKFVKVKGHSNCVGNRYADSNANLGRQELIKNPNFTEVCKLDLNNNTNNEVINENLVINKNKDINFSPWITGKKLFFKSDINFKLPNDYYFYTSLSYPKDQKHKDKYLGKRNADTHYSILLTKNKIELIDKFYKLFHTTFITNSVPILLDMPLIKKKDTLNNLINDFNKAIKVKSNLAITTDSTVLGEVFNPPKLVYKIESYFNYGLKILNDFIEDDDKISVIDITSFIYTNKKNNQIINSDFKTDNKSIIINNVKIVDRMLDVLLNVSIDLPNRNTCLAIAKENAITKCYLKIFDITKASYKVATIFSNEDNILLSYTIDSNFRLISE